MVARHIEAEALKLPIKRRSKLAVALLTSVQDEDPSAMDRIWADEAERRYRAYRKGRLAGTPASQALATARAAIKS